MKNYLLCKSIGNKLWIPTVLNSSYDHLFSPKSGHIIWESDKPVSTSKINELARVYKANIIWGD